MASSHVSKNRSGADLMAGVPRDDCSPAEEGSTALTGIALRKISLLPSRRKYDSRDGTGDQPQRPLAIRHLAPAFRQAACRRHTNFTIDENSLIFIVRKGFPARTPPN